MNKRGFTLIELMVGMTVAILIIGVVTATFLSQQRAVQALDLSREASNGSRDAMLSMQETIGRAGYGIDPRYAFDLTFYNTGTARDSITGPDEIVFVERDPNYYWSNSPATTVQGCDPSAPCSGHAWQITATNAGSGTLTILAHGGESFLKGQLVLIVCANGQNPLIGEVSSWNSASSTITLNVNNANPYRQMIPSSGANACYAAPGLSLFLVNRYHYHVVTIGGDPWLMLDRGIDYNGNGVTPENGGDLSDEIPIAHGVENIQFAYLLQPPPSPWTGGGAAPTAPDNNTNWVVGDTPGVVETPDPTATAPLQNTVITDPSRYNKHPANVRGIRVRITVRSLLKDLTAPGNFTGDAFYPPGATTVENANTLGAPNDKFRRYFTSVVVATPNLNSKDPFIF